MAVPTFHEPGSDIYVAATAPRNSSGTQRPAWVARATDAAQVGDIVREAARRGLRILPQATGHGAGGTVGEDTVLLDTSGLSSLTIDAGGHFATAGAGLTWGRVNAAAQEHGLLGLAGSAASVSIAGYTFGGGIGWLSRPHGMASAALRSVDYVDGSGALRNASDDAADALDRAAMFAVRGGGGVGIATALEFDLVAVPELHAGYLLWPVEDLDAVVTAWSAAMTEVGEDVVRRRAGRGRPGRPDRRRAGHPHRRARPRVGAVADARHVHRRRPATPR
ncbi:FAD-binding oxidoreductase [Nakamurella sp. A5-74]|uniref:FAD-binding oxidoreductase n=1 Tax=Nakamurella sp. A5-74 TaxID=3158264 RepID=A0AAU8DP91_9ACTN